MLKFGKQQLLDDGIFAGILKFTKNKFIIIQYIMLIFR